MPNWYEELKALFNGKIGNSEMRGTAYDTAWVASVPDVNHPGESAFPQALQWLRLHQRSDGSWGADIPYAHDRIISTLASLITLAKWSDDRWTRVQIESGLRSVWRNVTMLARDPYETIGFELIVPTLLEHAKKLAFNLPYSQFDDCVRKRKYKLSLLPADLVYSRRVSSIFSLEFLGDSFDIDAALANGGLSEVNGSVASSPSASAYYLTNVLQDDKAFDYLSALQKSGNGSIPAVAPFEIFERAWALYNLEKAGYNLASSEPHIAKHLEALYQAWTPHGVSHTICFGVPELDDTAVVFRVLRLGGFDVSLDVFVEYELEDHFRCFPYERNTSISAHFHLLEALNAAGMEAKDAPVQKALRFVIDNRIHGIYWFDKWHISPYYPTARAVMAFLGMNGNGDVADVMAQAVQWILQTQNTDGSWGFHGYGTAEETAYCLQALALYRNAGYPVDPHVILSAANFLIESKELQYRSYVPLWIGKSLYSPTYVVHSAVLSALSLAERADLVE